MNSLGKSGESFAKAYLESIGWEILAENWQCRFGEIDLVAHDPGTGATVVVEVKTRSSTKFGLPIEAVERRKLAKLRQLTGEYLKHSPSKSSTIRIDVIGILRRRGYAPEIDHRVGVA